MADMTAGSANPAASAASMAVRSARTVAGDWQRSVAPPLAHELRCIHPERPPGVGICPTVGESGAIRVIGR